MLGSVIRKNSVGIIYRKALGQWMKGRSTTMNAYVTKMRPITHWIQHASVGSN